MLKTKLRPRELGLIAWTRGLPGAGFTVAIINAGG